VIIGTIGRIITVMIVQTATVMIVQTGVITDRTETITGHHVMHRPMVITKNISPTVTSKKGW